MGNVDFGKTDTLRWCFTSTLHLFYQTIVISGVKNCSNILLVIH